MFSLLLFKTTGIMLNKSILGTKLIFSLPDLYIRLHFTVRFAVRYHRHRL